MPSVLLAHANPLTCDSAAKELARLGYAFSVVMDGRAAFDAALAGSFDVIVLDGALALLEGESLPELIAATGWAGHCLALQVRGDDPTDLPAGFSGQIHMDAPGGIEWIAQLGPYLPQAEARFADLTFESLKGFDRLAQRYRERLPTVLADLGAACEAGHWPDVQRRAHAIKGGAACFGFDQLTELAAQLEQCVAQGDTASASDLLAQMRIAGSVQ